jgi:hypothetical protein
MGINNPGDGLESRATKVGVGDSFEVMEGFVVQGVTSRRTTQFFPGDVITVRRSVEHTDGFTVTIGSCHGGTYSDYMSASALRRFVGEGKIRGKVQRESVERGANVAEAVGRGGVEVVSADVERTAVQIAGFADEIDGAP